MSGHSLQYLTILIAGLALLGCCASPAHGQIHDTAFQPELYVEVQDGYYVKKFDKDGRPIKPEKIISAAYRFEMLYDSTSRVQYLFSECRHNSTRLRLLAWSIYDVHTGSAEMMTENSRTGNFKIASGDTVSFYREFSWYNPMDARQDTNNFRSLDTLDYAIELVNSASGDRIALLDSFGVLSQPMLGVPVLYGTRPLMAHVNYIVPSTIPTNDSVFVRVRMYTRGEGLYLPIRQDDKTIGMSYSLGRGTWDEYLSLYSGSLSKRSTDDLDAETRRDGELLNISTAASGSITIHFSVSDGDGLVEIAIYDAAGNRVFVPYATRSFHGPGTATYHFSTSGTYFVVLLRNGNILEAKKISISL